MKYSMNRYVRIHSRKRKISSARSLSLWILTYLLVGLFIMVKQTYGSGQMWWYHCYNCDRIKPETEFYKCLNYCKECNKRIDKEYQQKHRGKILQYKKQWRKKNEKKIKQYYQNHKEEIKNRSRKIDWKKYRKEHIDKRRESGKKYYNTLAGKENHRKRIIKRQRNLGFEPQNQWQEGFVGHHHTKIIVYYIPEKVHISCLAGRNTKLHKKKVFYYYGSLENMKLNIKQLSLINNND